jgi:hypothetical protein
MCVCAPTGLSTALTMMDAMRQWRRDDYDNDKRKKKHNGTTTTAHHSL